ncbi:hypothetical protein NEDG_00217 [Nematocida displodere]|uniref:Uncharacterized protein n=1 Tax=Nematocida displodere TaxID=1805483 RepID=A0A177EKV4_9MICR|nr:hypothetical protein NEDG_00217 [Nematocida displodere]
MEPEVLIIEVTGEKEYKIFETGVSVRVCTETEALEHLEGKLHLFLVVQCNMDRKDIHKLAKFFFASSALESISVMYSAVAVSLALGVQNLAVIGLSHLKSGGIECSVDLVGKSSLAYPHSFTRAMEFDAFIDEVMNCLGSSTYRSTTSLAYIRGEASLRERAYQALEQRGLFDLSEEASFDETEAEGGGYRLAPFPSYFEKSMPHNLLPDSDPVYIGAVLTTMINYFEIKEVNTREDFEAGSTKHLILN